jgi:hypothetical protein
MKKILALYVISNIVLIFLYQQEKKEKENIIFENNNNCISLLQIDSIIQNPDCETIIQFLNTKLWDYKTHRTKE